jgi:hypothetical protein
MRVMFGMLGLFIVALIGFMYKTNQLPSLDKGILGMPGTTTADLDLGKIVSKYKDTLSGLEKRNQAMLNGELDEDKSKSVTDLSNNNKALRALMKEMPTEDAPPEEKPSLAPQPIAKVERPTRMFRYGMDLEKMSTESAKPYLGNWTYYVPQTQEYPVRINLRPDGAISNVSVNMQPNINASMGDNYTPLWKNTKTGQIIVLTGARDYILLSPHTSGLRGSLYRRGADGVTYQKMMEFPLQQM